jgi:type I restriction enzyme, S subunit
MKNGWTMRRLGEVCGFVRGPFGGSLKKSLFVQDGFAVYEQQHAIYGQFEEVRYFIDDVKFREMERFEVHPRDLVMSCSGTMGRVAIIPDNIRRGIINQALLKLTPSSEVSSEFLKYWMDSSGFQDSLKEQSGGAAIQNVASVGILKEIQISLPPLPEQRRIVGILDEAFEGIATAKANAEKNLQNARALFESHLRSVLSQHSKGWVEKPLSELCDIRHGFAFDGADFSNDVPEGNPLVITPGNFTEDGRLLFNEKNSKRFSGEPPADFQFDVGDLVVVMTDLSSKMKILGKPAFVETDGVLHNQRIGRVSFLNDCIEKRLLYYFMMTEGFLKNIKGSATGTMVKHTAPKRILSNVIPFPENRKEQRAIISMLDALRAETQRLASLCDRKLAVLDALKKSLLHQAFTGELTAAAGESVVIPFPIQIPNINTTDLHAGILAMAYELHVQNGKQSCFGHVKAEKIAHMVEASLGIDLGRSPVKDAAGPNDFPHLLKVEHRSRKANYFDFKPVDGAAYRVQKLRGFQQLVDKTCAVLGPRRDGVERLLQWMLPMTVQQSEIVATVFAAWNNLMLEGKLPTDEQIVFESRENWHPAKLKIDCDKFFKAVQWLRKEGRVPEGKGKRVK